MNAEPTGVATPRPVDPVPSADHSAYVSRDGDGGSAIHLLVEGVHCAGCISRIERAVLGLPEVTHARINLTTRQLVVEWRGDRLDPNRVVATVDGLGYRAVPFNPKTLRLEEDRETKTLLRALAVAGFAAANIMLLSVSVWAGAVADMAPSTRALMHWVTALIALPAVAYAIRPFAVSAIRALRTGNLNMDVPIAVAVMLATALSLVETVRNGEHVYFDAAVMLLFFLLIGRYLDRSARRRARSEAEDLLVLQASTASIIGSDGNVHRVPAKHVQPGMSVAIAPGERIPVDGIVAAGHSEIDCSLITGESLPRSARQGDRAYAGTINLSAPLTLRATAADEATLLAEIIRTIETAGQTRARYVRIADRAARVYAPVVHGLALAAFIGWIAFGGMDWQPALLIAVSVLIITCPCALGLAVPVVQVIATGRLMRRGILVKSGDALERLAVIDTVVFDKTGTLTLPEMELANGAEISESDLRLAGSLAANSRHPLARAVFRAAGPVPVIPDAREVPGAGVEAAFDGETVRLGRFDWATAHEDRAGGDRPELWLSRPHRPAVRFVFAEALRTDARQVIERLCSMGIAVELISGDRAPPVAAAARALGIEQWQATMRPDEKCDRLTRLTRDGRKILMVGDGLNDAPALAGAFASMSPTSAADISQTNADIVFQGERLWPVIEALEIARRSQRLVFQNFGLAALYNVVAIPLAVVGLVTPLIAAVAMSASSIAVILNALRLRIRA